MKSCPRVLKLYGDKPLWELLFVRKGSKRPKFSINESFFLDKVDRETKDKYSTQVLPDEESSERVLFILKNLSFFSEESL